MTASHHTPASSNDHDHDHESLRDETDATLMTPAALLQQVLTGVNELRGTVAAMRSEIAEVRREQHDMRAVMATKDDLKQYARIETVDGIRSTNDLRFNDLATRQTRMEDRYDKLRDSLHDRDVTDALREGDKDLAKEHRAGDWRTMIDARLINLLVVLFTLLLSPLIWSLISMLQHAVTHP